MRTPTSSVGLTAVLTGCILVCVSGRAYAYIDPGTGSYLLQFLIGALLAGGFAVKTFWGRIKAALARAFGRNRGPTG